MQLLALLALFALVACAAPSHPLTYVQPDDPVWWVSGQMADIQPIPQPAGPLPGPTDIHSAVPTIQNPVATITTPPPEPQPTWHPLVITDPRIKSATNIVITR